MTEHNKRECWCGLNHGPKAEDFSVGEMVIQKGYSGLFEVIGYWRGNVKLRHPASRTTHCALPSDLEYD